MLLCIFACNPIKASWVLTVYLDPKTVCRIKAPDVLNRHGFCNVITDWALLLLPIPMVWNLQMNIRKKIGLAGVFATGIFICAISITRQYILYHTDQFGDGYYATRIKIWRKVTRFRFAEPFILKLKTPVSLEFSFSIIVSCLPVLTPLFKKTSILASWLPSLRSKIMGSSIKQHKQPSSGTYSGGDQDIERNALRSDQQYPATTTAASSSWRAPQTWKEQEERTFDKYGSEDRESDVTLQDLPPHTHQASAAKGEEGMTEMRHE
ncbi:MAG: hypothetical protein Q9220_000385 [cf. Caloplaca sp. 1 TL-2023]